MLLLWGEGTKQVTVKSHVCPRGDFYHMSRFLSGPIYPSLSASDLTVYFKANLRFTCVEGCGIQEPYVHFVTATTD